MCVSRCLRCTGLALIPLALVCALSNILLLLPELRTNFLLDGHVTREAAWGSGLWGTFLVLISARTFLQGSKTRGCWAFRKQMLCQLLQSLLGLLAAAGCSLISFTGLTQGPLCLYNSTSGQIWGVPLKPIPDRQDRSGYLYNHSLWSGVCLEPRNVVQWNVILFSLMGGASFLQVLLCATNIINSAAGVIVGQGFCHNQVSPDLAL